MNATLPSGTNDPFPPLRLVDLSRPRWIEIRQDSCIVGRHRGSDLQLTAPEVSRSHCRLWWMDGTWQVQDLDSLNGTSLNGQQIKQETLQQDDILQIGDFMFRIEFRSSGQSQEANERGQRSRQVLHAIAAMLPEPSEIRGEDDLDRTGWSRDHDTPTGWPASTGSSA